MRTIRVGERNSDVMMKREREVDVEAR